MTVNVLRSAWIPAPPPESDPAMLNARGLAGARPAGRSASSTEVIPPSAFQRRLAAPRPERHDARSLDHDADVGERHPEALLQLEPGSLHAIVRQGRQQLVVVAPRQRQP